MKWIPVFTVLVLLIWSNIAQADITLCTQSYSNHQPRADVTYNNQSAVQIPDPILMPVTIDMAERYDLNLPKGANVETYVGMMEIYKDGRILYEGIDISGNIEDVCESDTDDYDIILNE